MEKESYTDESDFSENEITEFFEACRIGTKNKHWRY